MNTRVINLPQYKHLFFGLAFIAILSAGLYMYGVANTVRNIVARQAIESSLSDISIQTNEEEFAYIDASNAIDLTKAQSMGFTEVEADTFVPRDPNVAMAYGSQN